MSSPFYEPVSQKLPANEKVQTSSSVDVQFVDTRCGFGIWKPACMQPLATIGAFTACFSFSSLMTQTLMSYVNSQVTTLERQFGFSSRQTGLILAANDIGYLVCVLFVAYTANRIHIPRSLGVAVILYGLSGIACSLPHFLFGASNVDPTRESINSTGSTSSQKSAVSGSLCDLFNNTGDPCGIIAGQKVSEQTNQAANERTAHISLIIIFMGMALQGFGKAPRFSFSLVYIDDNTAKVNTGFYVGIMISMSIMGPVAAFLLGGVFSRMYVTLEATELTPRHPKWIGAWWLGYVVFGVLSLIVCIPLFCFPRKLPRNKAKDIHGDDEKKAGEPEKCSSGLHVHRNDDLKTLVHLHTPVKQSNKDTTRTSHTGHIFRGMRFKSLLKHIREFLAVLYRLCTNPVYVSMVVSSCFYVFMYAGDNAFFPKYLERMFNLPIHTSNYITAGIHLCTSCVGSFIGGVLSRRFKLTVITALKVTLIMTTTALGVHLLTFLFQCEQPTVYNWPGEDNACNSGCNCRDNSYFPICGGDGRTYYSPCHAGCPQTELGMYQNCSCITGGLAKAGTCDYGCPYLYAYIITVGVRSMLMTLITIPKVITYMRCVPEEDRAMALSVSPFMTSLFGRLAPACEMVNAVGFGVQRYRFFNNWSGNRCGYVPNNWSCSTECPADCCNEPVLQTSHYVIPSKGWLLAPILFGNIIDNTCLIWDIKCLTRGRCLHYDNNQFRVKFLGYEALGLSGTALFVSAAYLYARWTGCLDPVTQNKIVQETPETKPVANDDVL